MKNITLSLFFLLFLVNATLAIDIDRVLNSVVKVCLTHPEHNTCVTGTGFCIKKTDKNEYLFLTAGHVVNEEAFHKITIWQFYPLNLFIADLKVKKFNMFSEVEDFAILSVDDPIDNMKPLTISEIMPVEGEILYMAGCQESNWLSIKKVTCSKVTDNTIQFYPEPHSGASGGPLLNSDGEVIGIMTKSDENKFGLATRIDRVPLSL